MVIKIHKTADDLKISTPDLIARANGRMIYERVKKQLHRIDSGETVIIDFDGIKVIDSSFIDEFLVKVIMESTVKDSGFFVKLRNLSQSSELNIDSVFHTYSAYNNNKLVILTEDLCSNNNFFIGHLKNTSRDILHYLRLNRSGSIPDIVEFTGLGEDEIKKTMEELREMRLVRDENGGYYSGV